MGNFAFHGWVLVEIFTDTGLVGLGNAALSPLVTKTLIDTYLKPLLIGADPWDTEYPVAADVSPHHGLRPQGRRDDRDLRGRHRAVGPPRQGREAARLSPARRPHEGADSRVRQPALLRCRSMNCAPKRRSTRTKATQAMKLRFGWGPMDGAAGMQKNVELVRTVREVIGDGVDLMADAYMGWTLDYAKRMLPLLEPFHLRWLEEPVIPDDTRGYSELKSYGRVPIAGGEHEFTIFGFRDLLEANALDYIQFDTNRVGGISQARKISALAESSRFPSCRTPARCTTTTW